MAVGGGGAVDALAQAVVARENAGAARIEAELANRRLYDVKMNMAQRAWEGWNPTLFLGSLDDQRPENQKGVDRRGFEWYYWRQNSRRGIRPSRGIRPLVGGVQPGWIADRLRQFGLHGQGVGRGHWPENDEAQGPSRHGYGRGFNPDGTGSPRRPTRR